MKWVLISALLMIGSFFLGIWIQAFCLKINKQNEDVEKMRASRWIRWLFRMYTSYVSILVKSLFSEKDRVYLREIQHKVIVPGKLERNFYNALLKEKNPRKIRIIIETVFHQMEKRKRKRNPKEKAANYTFITQYALKGYPAYGMKMVEYVELFVLYNRYLKGEYLKPERAKKAAELFGLDSEVDVAEYEIQKQNHWQSICILSGKKG